MPDSGGLCPSGMVWVPAPGRFCIDKYEASYAASATKPDGTPCSSNCPISQYNTPPWTAIKSPAPSQNQAKILCQNMGKDLPTDFEWWLAAAGTPDPHNSAPSLGTEPCQIWNTTGSWPSYSARKPNGSVWAQTSGWPSTSTAAINTGTATQCQSIVGAMDMIGNVFEWTNNTLTCNGTNCSYQGITMPAGGYIASINDEGIPLTTGSAQFNNDYYWTNIAANTYGFLRSGSWDIGAYAGRFVLYVHDAPGNTDYNIGFRCLLR
jgi:formylglycine-generating enzyme required for sulfatase activity